MNLSPYIRFAKDDKLNGIFELKERIIFDYELLFVMEGKLIITVEDEVYNVAAGDVFLFRPNRRHSMRCLSSDGFRQPHIHFDLVRQEDSERVPVSFKSFDEMTEEERGMIRPDLLTEEGLNLPDKLCIGDLNTFQRLLFEVIHEYENKMPFSDLNAQGVFLQLLAYILRQYIDSEIAGDMPYKNIMMKIRQYLNVNTNISISLEDLAAKYNISKFHLAHTFKAMYGMAPIQYHLYCRMEKAKSMILYTQRPITYIANEVGYTSLNDFSRAFKKRYAQSPMEFRKKGGK